MSNWLISATKNSPPDMLSHALSEQAALGDDLAELAIIDKAEEEDWMQHPFKVGEKVFLVTVTLYYLGEVEACGLGWVRLKDASWIHWTGRLGSLLASGDITAQHGRRKPRSEYCGSVTVYLQALIAHYPWTGKIHKESVE